MLRSLLAVALVSTAAAQPDTIYINANVYTVNPDQPRAQAVAIEDGRITAVGRTDVLRTLANDDTDIVDANGFTLLPGFIDAHGHLYGLGQLEVGVVDLSGTKSYEEVIGRIVDRAGETPEGQWIIGRGWDNESWPDRDLPHHRQLSEATPDHPVYLQRVDGHAGLANERAMTAARLSPGIPPVEGGEVMRDDEGALTGVFIDNAERYVTRAIPASAQPNTRQTILAAQRLLFEEGVTGMHDMGVNELMLANYRLLMGEGVLKLRISAYIAQNIAPRYFEKNDPVVGDQLSVLGVKVYMDGAMGSRGAWLLEPYADRPTDDAGEPYTGLAVTDDAYLEGVIRQAMSRDYQIAAHAIGDRANRKLLDLFTRASLASRGKDRRWRIEHAQLLHPDDIDTFARASVIASMQPTHCTSDMRWVEDRVGRDRARGAYAWASLLRSGARIASGSDFPVEGHDPLLGFYAAVTRQNAQGWPEGGWHPEQRMTRTEALRTMTLDAAFAAFAEDRVGSIEVGKLADLVLLDTDIMTCDPLDILRAQVVRTVVGGETVYERGSD